ncbi:MAG: phosphonate C-P lyase system protein PhnH [Planctomycetota bacterium]|nr:phosphonate C-P lyase system protein PhnH [Planctomycetota bacterium]MCX8039512.1 phosphonate C-P lyase system protein PhnH [Planctomycetota bacterium]MDW8373032.1 phosphonate C-P lyase system protein PhnH [Planctomycetota bacterium]
MIAIDHPWRSDGQRQVFRRLLAAWAEPGSVADIAPWCGGAHASLAVLACLCDAATSFCDADQLLSPTDRSRLAARPAPAGEAAFILADAARPPAWVPERGSLLAPERGATIVLRCQSLGEGAVVALRGPGIAERAALAVSGLHPAWWTARACWCAYPLGVDFVFCDATRLACVPRTTTVGGEES